MNRYCLTFIMLFSTAALSQESKFGIGTQLGIHASVPVAGVELLMPVSDQLSMSYAYTTGKTSMVGVADTSPITTQITKADLSLSETSVSFRWLLSQSFYLGAGAGYRVIQLDMAGKDWFDASSAEASVHSESLQAKILLGNIWNFSNGVYLGVDWVGFGVPLAVTRSKAEITEFRNNQRTSLTEDNDRETKQVVDKLGHATFGSLLTLRLGVKF